MATIPTVPTEVPGNFWTAALWNANVLGGLNYLFAPVRFKGYSSTSQSFANGATGIPLTLDTELYDSDGGHSTVTNTSRYTFNTPGLYLVGGSVCFATNATGARAAQISLNGLPVTGSLVQSAAQSANGGSVMTTTEVQVNVGDYVELAAWQTSGGALSTSVISSTSVNSTMWLLRISA